MEVHPARSSDARGIVGLLDAYAAQGLLLSRTLPEVLAKIRDFTVASEGDVLLGVVALHPVSETLAEIRSLAVRAGKEKGGLGSLLVEAALKDAARLGFERVFALTYRKGFFERLGFQPVDRRTLPQKIWMDCVHCAKYSDCDETALIKTIR